MSITSDEGGLIKRADCEVAAMKDVLRKLSYEDLLHHAAVATFAAAEFSAMLDQSQASLRSCGIELSDSAEKLHSASVAISEIVKAAQDERTRIKGKAAELIKTAYADGAKKAARAGGIAKNNENKAIKDDVFRWLSDQWDEYRFRSNEVTAKAIFEDKLVPLEMRTIKEYVAEFKELATKLPIFEWLILHFDNYASPDDVATAITRAGFLVTKKKAFSYISEFQRSEEKIRSFFARNENERK